MKKTINNRAVFSLRFWWGIFGVAVLGLVLALATGCEKDDDDTPEPIPDNNSVTEQFTTDDDAGKVELDGYTLELMPGTIPTLANGGAATVTFSIETDVETPKPLPNGMDQVGKTVHFGPEGFIFQSPILVKFPLPEEYTPDKVSIVFYDDESDQWKVVPTGFTDLDNREIGAFVLSLDYFTLAYVEELNQFREEGLAGGIQWNNADLTYPVGPQDWNMTNTYVILTVKSFTPKYNYGTPFIDLVGQVAMTPSIAPGGSPNHSIGFEWWMRQGTYELWIGAQRRVLGEIQTRCYSIPMTVTVGESVTCSWSSCSGWSNVPGITGGGTWYDARCGDWPQHTVPVCTGEFQATLTWYNGSGEVADLDLHLYGPDGLNVFHENTDPDIGGLVLDRDVIYDQGNVQENICAPTLDGMPRGDYRIAVQHYNGPEKDFQVRLILDDKSENFSGTISSTTTPTASNTGKPEMTVFDFSLE